MKIDFSSPMKTLRGEPIAMEEGKADLMTLAVVAVEALLTAQEADRQTAGLSFRLYKLADRIKDAGEHDLEADEIALVKARVEQRWPPLISGQAWDLLEGRGA